MKSSRFNRNEINPQFIKNQTSKDNTQSLVYKFRRARATGQLNLASQFPTITQIPLEIFELENHSEVDEKFWEFETLKSLDLSFNAISSIPNEIGNLKDLSVFKIKNNAVTSLPEEFFTECISIKILDISENKVSTLSQSIGLMNNLQELFLSNNLLTELPQSIQQCSHLRILDLKGNSIVSLVEEVGNLTHLVKLDVSKNKLRNLPTSVANLKHLKEFSCSENMIQSLPDLSSMNSLELLDATQNSISYFPCLPPNLTHLHLGYNRLTSIESPTLFSQSALCELMLHNNLIHDLPENIELLQSLKTLDLSNNDIRELPPTIGWMDSLQRLRVDGNPLKSIRQVILTKPTDEIKRYLMTRGPSILNADSKLEFIAPNEEEANKVRSLDGQIQFRIRDATNDHLDLSGLSLQSEPQDLIPQMLSMPNTSHLTSLDLSNNSLEKLPLSLIKAFSKSLVKINLTQNKLFMDSSEIDLLEFREQNKGNERRLSLDISKNQLSCQWVESVLNSFGLFELHASGNPLSYIPLMLNKQVDLELLDLSYCKISSLEGLEFFSLRKLKSLNLSNNQIKSIPPSIVDAHLIEYLSVENNCISEIPSYLGNLEHLKYLLINGNPQKNIRMNIVSQGSQKVIALLKSRCQSGVDVYPNPRIQSNAFDGASNRPFREDIAKNPPYPPVPMSSMPLAVLAKPQRSHESQSTLLTEPTPATQNTLRRNPKPLSQTLKEKKNQALQKINSKRSSNP